MTVSGANGTNLHYMGVYVKLNQTTQGNRPVYKRVVSTFEAAMAGPDVSCGGHRAPSCNECPTTYCPSGNCGKDWCNGECTWVGSDYGGSCITLLNAGQDCWGACQSQQGLCAWCGSGSCCRKGWAGNGCDGLIGDPDRHVCSAVGPPYLFYWPGFTSWRIGADYTDGWSSDVRSTATEALCPEQATAYAAWTGSAWSGGVTVGQPRKPPPPLAPQPPPLLRILCGACPSRAAMSSVCMCLCMCACAVHTCTRAHTRARART